MLALALLLPSVDALVVPAAPLLNHVSSLTAACAGCADPLVQPAVAQASDAAQYGQFAMGIAIYFVGMAALTAWYGSPTHISWSLCSHHDQPLAQGYAHGATHHRGFSDE